MDLVSFTEEILNEKLVHWCLINLAIALFIESWIILEVISEKDKIKLQHKMAYGDDIGDMLIQEKLKPAPQNNDVEEPYDEFYDGMIFLFMFCN